MDNKIEGTEKELLQKVEMVKGSLKIEDKRKLEISHGTLDEKLEDVADKIPDEEIRNDIEKVVNILKKEKISDEAAEELFDIVFNTNKALYIDNRPYVRMAKRSLSEHRMGLMIGEIIKNKELNVSELRKIVRINFDLNGLKPMNDLGGHDKGNEGLKIFSDILREGKTTKWLEDAGFKVIPSSEGGDEFGMVISGIENDRPIDDLLLQEIKKRYMQEVYTTPAGHLVDFKDKEVQKKLIDAGKNQAYIDQAIASDFEFKMSTSMGVARLDQALLEIDIRPERSYKETVRAIIGKMFSLADNQAIENKTKFKRGLAESADIKDTILSDLIDRDKGAKQKDEIIKKQEEENNQLREILMEAGFAEDQIQKKIEEKRLKVGKTKAA